MPQSNDIKQSLPEHVEETVRSIAEVHVRHFTHASISQRVVNILTNRLAHPLTTGLITLAIVTYIVVNLILQHLHTRPFDPPPFPLLGTIGALFALCVTSLILTTQRHENTLAEHRAQLTLEIAMISEQKMAKLIRMIEKQRHDNPLLNNHEDSEAREMAQPADPHAMLDIIRENHRDT